jgi:DNA-binding SARP family transcriptional activator
MLGGFEVRLADGSRANLQTRKNEALLALLAYRLGEPMSRDRIIGILWGDRGEKQARHSLSQSLSELRSALPGSNGFIDIRRDAIAIDDDFADIDVASFERLGGSQDRDALRQAASLYRGPLLDGFALRESGFEDWLVRERTRLAERAGAILLQLADAETAAMDEGGAIAALTRAIDLDPLSEAAHRRLIRMHIDQAQAPARRARGNLRPPCVTPDHPMTCWARALQRRVLTWDRGQGTTDHRSGRCDKALGSESPCSILLL